MVGRGSLAERPSVRRKGGSRSFLYMVGAAKSVLMPSLLDGRFRPRTGFGKRFVLAATVGDFDASPFSIAVLKWRRFTA